MTIEELLRVARSVDAGVTYVISDSTTYGPRLGQVERTVSVEATIDGEGSSLESMALRMARRPLGSGRDDVAAVVPGKTNTYRQVHPLVEALRRDQPVSA